MISWRKLRTRWRAVFRKQKLDTEMDEEMRSHIEMRTQMNIEKGMNPEEARFAALRQFGWAESIKEECRDRRGMSWLENLMQDVRFAARTLRKSPAFAVVAVMTLAIGIGANTSLFTAVDAIILRPLPVPEAGRLAYVTSGRTEDFSFSFYEHLRQRTKSFDGFAAVHYGAMRRELIAAGATGTESVLAQGVTGNFFEVLRVPAQLGRTLDAGDDRAGAAQPVVVISHAFWQRRFAADPAVIGQGVQLDDASVTIVGVMPAGFAGFEVSANPDLWYPVQLVTQLSARDRRRLDEGVSWLVLFGRLRDGVTHEQTQAELGAIFQQRLEDQVSENASLTPPERERVLKQTLELHSGAAGYVRVRSLFRQPLVILMSAVGVVLMIACANIAGLLLARGAARHHELAVRAALGAGRGRIMRYLVTESILLAVMGGAAGLIFARWGTAFLSNYLAQSDATMTLEPDGRVLLFTIIVSLLTGVIFGLAPAWRLSRLDLVTAIKNQSHSVAGGSRMRLQPALVIAQVALTVLLLAGAGLFARTLRNLQTLDFGFHPDNLISLALDSGRRRPSNPAQINALMQRLLAGLEAMPGVRSASVGGAGMLSGNGYSTDFAVDGYVPAPGEEMRASVAFAGPRFFETLQLPLLRGREFNLSDEPAPEPGGAPKPATVVILGEAMARKFFGDADPIGRYITRGGQNGVRLEVVGVAKDSKYSRNLRDKTPLQFYSPYFGAAVPMPPNFYLRTGHSAAAIKADILNVVNRIEPRVTVRDLRTMNEVIDRLLVRERVMAQLVGFFSAFALLLAALGIYGLLSYGVAQRTREIGARMALGATVQDIVALVLRHGLMLTLIGGTIGIGAALILTRLVAALLYGVKPFDPFTFAAVTGGLVAVVLVVSWLPARRAAKVDPMIALRNE